MAWLSRTLSSSIGKKAVMAASGAILAFFVLIHALGNSFSYQGREALLNYAGHLHALGPLVPVLELLLAAVFLVHIGTGLLLFLENRAARPCRYEVHRCPSATSLAARTMPYSGLLLLLFLVFHLLRFRLAPPDLPLPDLLRATLAQPANAVLYLAGVATLALHANHGLWSIWQTLGIDHPKLSPWLKSGAMGFSLALAVLLGLIPILCLLNPNFLR